MRRARRRYFLPVIIAIGMVMSLADQSWAQSSPLTIFHGGPEHTGVYEPTNGLAMEGLQWRVATNGDVISSPAIERNTAYVGSGDGHLYALNLLTGS